MDAASIDMERFAARTEELMTIANRYHSDAEFRAAVDADPAAALAERGVELPDGKETQISCNTADTFHIVMPEDPNLSLDDEALGMVAGGKGGGGGGPAAAGIIGVAAMGFVGGLEGSAGTAHLAAQACRGTSACGRS